MAPIYLVLNGTHVYINGTLEVPNGTHTLTFSGTYKVTDGTHMVPFGTHGLRWAWHPQGD